MVSIEHDRYRQLVTDSVILTCLKNMLFDTARLNYDKTDLYYDADSINGIMKSVFYDEYASVLNELKGANNGTDNVE